MTTTTAPPLLRPRRRGRVRWDVAAVVAAVALVVVAAVEGWHLLHRRVPLNLQFPPLFARWLPHTGVGTGQPCRAGPRCRPDGG